MLLENERGTAYALLPQLVDLLDSRSMLELESSSAKDLASIFRTHGQPGLTIAPDLGGFGLLASDLVCLLSWVSTRSPSLALMMTMHHHTVAGIMETSCNSSEKQSVLSQVARDKLLVASGFAEGLAHTSIFNSRMTVNKVEGGHIVSGSKKPCTMAHNFDFVTIGANYFDIDGCEHINAGIFRAGDPCIERREFWSADHLKASDSHEIILNNAFVPDSLMCFSTDPNNKVDNENLEASDFSFEMWFLLLVSATYLGMANSLGMRAIHERKGSVSDRAALIVDLQGATMALRSAAQIVDAKQYSYPNLARLQAVRFSVQEAINRVTTRAFEISGGMAFLSSRESAYLLVASRLLAFHPTSKVANSEFLCEQLGQ